MLKSSSERQLISVLTINASLKNVYPSNPTIVAEQSIGRILESRRDIHLHTHPSPAMQTRPVRGLVLHV
jgi:hypothetical protein